MTAAAPVDSEPFAIAGVPIVPERSPYPTGGTQSVRRGCLSCYRSRAIALSHRVNSHRVKSRQARCPGPTAYSTATSATPRTRGEAQPVLTPTLRRRDEAHSPTAGGPQGVGNSCGKGLMNGLCTSLGVQRGAIALGIACECVTERDPSLLRKR